jgi:hypothetical protein
MAWDHFLQAAARITQLVRSRQSAEPAVGREVRALVSASSKGGEWRTKQAENAVSRSHLAWPLRHAAFSGNPGGDALAAYLSGSCGVRARCSVRVRSRTGRLRRFDLSSFHRLTLSSRGRLSPKPLRLTRPERATHDVILGGDATEPEIVPPLQGGLEKLGLALFPGRCPHDRPLFYKVLDQSARR